MRDFGVRQDLGLNSGCASLTALPWTGSLTTLIYVLLSSGAVMCEMPELAGAFLAASCGGTADGPMFSCKWAGDHGLVSERLIRRSFLQWES